MNRLLVDLQLGRLGWRVESEGVEVERAALVVRGIVDEQHRGRKKRGEAEEGKFVGVGVGNVD